MYNEFETRWGYLLELLWIAFLVFYHFWNVVFRRLPGMEQDPSLRIALLLLATGLCVTFLMCGRNYRTVGSTLFASCVPLGLYTYIVLFPYYKVIFISAVLAVVLVTGGFTLWVMRSPIRDRARQRVIRKRRRHNCVAVAGMCLTLCALVSLGCGTYARMHGGLPLKAEESQRWHIPEGSALKDNREVLVNLEESRWEPLSTEQRLDLLRVLVKIEQAHLGLPDDVTLHADFLRENVLGQMNPRTNRITVDLDHLKNDDPRDVVDTVLHECRHIYSNQLAKLYQSAAPEFRRLQVFAGVDQYAAEYDNYINGCEGNEEEYYFQSIEMDAREYAAFRTDMVFREIDIYLTEGVQHE